jgi:hypothetical protein
MLARDEQIEIDIVSQSKQIPLEQTQQYQDDCDFVDQYRKENPGRSDEIRQRLQSNPQKWSKFITKHRLVA